MASDLRGYTEQEVLNKVLNTSNDSIKVDIVAGAEYAEDAEHSSGDTGQFVLGVRSDSLSALGANGDYVPFQMNASGALYVDVADGGQLDTIIDTLETTLTAIETDAAAIEVLLIAANVDHAANEALLTTIDADTGAIKTAVETIDNAISGTEMQVDVVAISAQSDGTYIGDIKFGESLPAGSAAIGKLAANDGVDIGDVDVTSVTTGYAAANLGKREDDAHANQDVGVMALAVRNDDVAALGSADGDYAPLQVNAAGSLYVKDETGEAGSIYVGGTTAVTSPSNTKFVAIQFIEDSVFDSGNDGLISATNQLYPSTQYTGTDIDADGGAVVDSVTFPQGMTIFGRWSGFKLASGKVIAYIAHV